MEFGPALYATLLQIYRKKCYLFILSNVIIIIVRCSGSRILLHPRYSGAEYCDKRVCLSVCLQAYLKNHTLELHQTS